LWESGDDEATIVVVGDRKLIDAQLQPYAPGKGM